MKAGTKTLIEGVNRNLRSMIDRFPSGTLAVVAALVVFGGMGTYMLRGSQAATPTASIEAESGSRTTNATAVSDTTASASGALKFSEPSPGGGDCTPVSHIPAGFPNNCTAGYKAAPDYPGSLTNFSGSIQSGQTYRFKRFTGGTFVGSSSTSVSNVTFYGCLFEATGDINVALFGDNITFEYSTFAPSGERTPPISYSQGYQYGIEANGSYYSNVQKLTVSNSEFWGFGNAIDTRGSTQAKPHVFRGNYIHDARADGGIDHTDGIGDLSGSGSGTYVVLDNNTIESAGNTNGIAYQQGSYNNFTITNNLIGGWGYAVALWAPAPNTTFTGNTFSTRLKPVFGPLYPQSFWTSSGSVWRNNRWYVPAGAAYGNPADNGKFWTPSGPSNTDYQ